MTSDRAPLPESMRGKFEQYQTWSSAGEVQEIGLEDSEEDIQKARESDPDYVATLKYLGLDAHPMWIMRGFEEPDGDTVERWYLSSAPWPFQQTGTVSERMIQADYLGPCTLCNPEGDEASLDDECPECEGDGSTQYWFEDFDENMVRVD
jgi:hypothetical protein